MERRNPKARSMAVFLFALLHHSLLGFGSHSRGAETCRLMYVIIICEVLPIDEHPMHFCRLNSFSLSAFAFMQGICWYGSPGGGVLSWVKLPTVGKALKSCTVVSRLCLLNLPMPSTTMLQKTSLLVSYRSIQVPESCMVCMKILRHSGVDIY